MTDMQAATLPWLTPTAGEIDPAARTLLEFMAARAKAPPSTDGKQSNGNLSGRPEPIEAVEDLLIDGAEVPIHAQLYRPAGSASGPLLLWFHGGGFVGGGQGSHDVPLRALANRAACGILAVDYRLAPADPFPAAVNDAAASIGWAATHAASLGFDPARIMVGGDSAGGNVATVGAMLARDQGLGPVVLQLLVYPDADARAGSNQPSWQQNDGIVLDRKGKEVVLDQYLPPGIDRTQPHASPALAPLEALHGLPPTLVVTAEFDPQRDEGELYADRLREAGVRVALVRYPGMIHGFMQMAGVLKQGRALIDQLAAAIRSS
ncbi:alpha/beta hydrolase [Lichenicola sp.]|uniref:alpha/beta hydrolase n=1 Tax=Lichenicola sp. TaxID=2804529 RepID=UPI003B003D36